MLITPVGESMNEELMLSGHYFKVHDRSYVLYKTYIFMFEFNDLEQYFLHAKTIFSCQ